MCRPNASRIALRTTVHCCQRKWPGVCCASTGPTISFPTARISMRQLAHRSSCTNSRVTPCTVCRNREFQRECGVLAFHRTDMNLRVETVQCALAERSEEHTSKLQSHF